MRVDAHFQYIAFGVPKLAFQIFKIRAGRNKAIGGQQVQPRSGGNDLRHGAAVGAHHVVKTEYAAPHLVKPRAKSVFRTVRGRPGRTVAFETGTHAALQHAGGFLAQAQREANQQLVFDGLAVGNIALRGTDQNHPVGQRAEQTVAAFVIAAIGIGDSPQADHHVPEAEGHVFAQMKQVWKHATSVV